MYEGLLCWVQEKHPYFEEKNNSFLVRQIHIAFKRDSVFDLHLIC